MTRSGGGTDALALDVVGSFVAPVIGYTDGNRTNGR
jgi:hypothetical protein